MRQIKYLEQGFPMWGTHPPHTRGDSMRYTTNYLVTNNGTAQLNELVKKGVFITDCLRSKIYKYTIC